LFGVSKIPGDNQARARFDPFEPTHFFPVFANASGSALVSS
jgi:hypothetical protein